MLLQVGLVQHPLRQLQASPSNLCVCTYSNLVCIVCTYFIHINMAKNNSVASTLESSYLHDLRDKQKSQMAMILFRLCKGIWKVEPKSCIFFWWSLISQTTIPPCHKTTAVPLLSQVGHRRWHGWCHKTSVLLKYYYCRAPHVPPLGCVCKGCSERRQVLLRARRAVPRVSQTGGGDLEPVPRLQGRPDWEVGWVFCLFRFWVVDVVAVPCLVDHHPEYCTDGQWPQGKAPSTARTRKPAHARPLSVPPFFGPVSYCTPPRFFCVLETTTMTYGKTPAAKLWSAFCARQAEQPADPTRTSRWSSSSPTATTS